LYLHRRENLKSHKFGTKLWQLIVLTDNKE
jgi:hypothetical protein